MKEVLEDSPVFFLILAVLSLFLAAGYFKSYEVFNQTSDSLLSISSFQILFSVIFLVTAIYFSALGLQEYTTD